MHKELNRWAVLISSMGILMCTGAVYAFSIFAGPLSAESGWTMENVMVAFAINAAVGPIPMILGGFLTDRGWSRWSIMAGGILFGLGFALAGTATSLAQLYFYYGIIGGIGQGFAYSGCLNNTIRLFPDKRGLASGLITGGMGGAAIIAAPVANSLIQSVGVNQTFILMGITYAVISFVCSLFIKTAPKDFVPKNTSVTQANTSNGTFENKNWKEMLQSVNFYLILFMLAMGAFSGLMIASNASPIGQSMFGLTAAAAAGYVSLYSLSNTLGRVVWGAVSDRIGRSNTINVMYSVIVLTFIILILVRSTVGFTIGIVGLGLCFGGVMGVFPSLVMENFGPKYQGVNYGIVFIGYSVSAYFAPKIAAGMAASANGDFSNAFYVAIAVALGGLALNVLYMLKRRSLAVSNA